MIHWYQSIIFHSTCYSRLDNEIICTCTLRVSESLTAVYLSVATRFAARISISTAAMQALNIICHEFRSGILLMRDIILTKENKWICNNCNSFCSLKHTLIYNNVSHTK